jgi:hypothetical protein
MLEIYNEEYKDLLARGKGAGKKHNVRTRVQRVACCEARQTGARARTRELVRRTRRSAPPWQCGQ